MTGYRFLLNNANIFCIIRQVETISFGMLRQM